MFNWYLTKQNDKIILNGDLCITEMRHEEYISEKQKYASTKNIALRDKNYISKHPNSYRECIFIQKPITGVLDDNRIQSGDVIYRLINLDSFFEFNPERKDTQIKYLRRN